MSLQKIPIEELVDKFLKKGGHIDKFYLQNPTKSKQSLVHLNGWFSGHNIREAISKALGDK